MGWAPSEKAWGIGEETGGRSEDSLSSEAFANPFSLLGRLRLKEDLAKSVYQSKDLAASNEVVPKASPTPAQQLPTCPHHGPVHGLVHPEPLPETHIYSQ